MAIKINYLSLIKRNCVADDVDFTVFMFDDKFSNVFSNVPNVDFYQLRDAVMEAAGDSLIMVPGCAELKGAEMARCVIDMLPEEFLFEKECGLNIINSVLEDPDSALSGNKVKNFFHALEDGGVRLSSVRIAGLEGFERMLYDFHMKGSLLQNIELFCSNTAFLSSSKVDCLGLINEVKPYVVEQNGVSMDLSAFCEPYFAKVRTERYGQYVKKHDDYIDVMLKDDLRPFGFKDMFQRFLSQYCSPDTVVSSDCLKNEFDYLTDSYNCTHIENRESIQDFFDNIFERSNVNRDTSRIERVVFECSDKKLICSAFTGSNFHNGSYVLHFDKPVLPKVKVAVRDKTRCIHDKMERESSYRRRGY